MFPRAAGAERYPQLGPVPSVQLVFDVVKHIGRFISISRPQSSRRPLGCAATGVELGTNPGVPFLKVDAVCLHFLCLSQTRQQPRINVRWNCTTLARSNLTRISISCGRNGGVVSTATSGSLPCDLAQVAVVVVDKDRRVANDHIARVDVGDGEIVHPLVAGVVVNLGDGELAPGAAAACAGAAVRSGHGPG